MLAIKDGTPEDDSHEDVVDPTETYAEAFLFERDKRERREAKTRELARLFRRATLLTIAAAIPRLTSAEFHYLVHETARVFLAWGMPIWMLPGLLQDIYRIAYQEDFVNALVANDLREVIRLEGEKTRAEVRELGNLIVGSVIAREGSVIEAAEEILTGEEGSSV